MARIGDLPAGQEVLGCIWLCIDTQRTCLNTVRYCLDKGGRYSLAMRIHALLDAANMCETCADDCRFGSVFCVVSWTRCADVLEGCCRVFEPLRGDPKLDACLKACRECAEYCRSLTAAVAA